ncbi:adenosylcobinamide kinase [Angustibacter aerolatus]|uniref:Adenosylcobinamide kinase n=1 Tax=Angustibacter aerolatus TaxID=1162965 RepID=A0ABQ6JLC7_9ACTN|nr:adenosylcobinamide kinase [Angustibacter aerolatus]
MTALPARTLVLGGSGSGKSAVAEALVRDLPHVTYVATGAAPDAADPAWAQRVQRHRDRRPAGWGTLETTDVAGVLRAHRGPLLVDSLGTWLAGVLDACDGWSDGDAWRPAYVEAADALVAAWQHAAGPVVLVADEVGSGVVPSTPAGRRFRDLLGPLTTRLSRSADRALLVVAGRALEPAAAAPWVDDPHPPAPTPEDA